MKSLEQLREILRAGQAASLQGSLQRRAPAKQALPALLEARAGLRQLVWQQPEVAEAWRLLSQAEEALLSYTAARESLEQAMKLTPVRDRRDLKKLALLKEYEPRWKELGLTPDQLAELGSFLQRQLGSSPCAHDLAWTRRWLEQAGITGAKKVLKAFQNQGGFCDCEVLANVVADEPPGDPRESSGRSMWSPAQSGRYPGFRESGSTPTRTSSRASTRTKASLRQRGHSKRQDLTGALPQAARRLERRRHPPRSPASGANRRCFLPARVSPYSSSREEHTARTRSS